MQDHAPRILLLLLMAFGMTAGDARAESIEHPLLGYVPVGRSSHGDDRGPSPRVMAANHCLTDGQIATVVYSNWQAAQPEDPGENWDAFTWDWFDEALEPWLECDALLLSYTYAARPMWLEADWNTDEHWRRQDVFWRAYFERCGQAGVFHHIFENEPDGLIGSRDDWAEWYLEKLRRAHAAAKAVDPRHQLIGGNMFTTRAYPDFYAQGFADICDVVGFHNYSDNPHTGNDLEAVIRLRRIMEEHDHGDALIFLGEGWGPGRELTSVRRAGHHDRIMPEELRDLRHYLLNGHENLTTRTPRFDPGWLLGAYFFTLNDNYGGWYWRDRAVPHHAPNGALLYYTVDGYNVGRRVEPRFYNGGLATYDGVSKDTLLDLFPGNQVALANPGFEYEEYDGRPYGWDVQGQALVDRSVAFSGRHALRLRPIRDTPATCSQEILANAVPRAVEHGLILTARVFALDATSALDLRLELIYDGVAAATAGVEAVTGWQELRLRHAPTAGTRSIAVRLSNAGGNALWVDDCFLTAGEDTPPVLRAFVYDANQAPIDNATIAIAPGTTNADPPSWSMRPEHNGELLVNAVPPGVFDLVCTAPGFEPRTLPDVVLAPGVTRVAGFELVRADPYMPANIRAQDALIGGTIRLHWQAPLDPAVARVDIHRATSVRTLGPRIASVTHATEYTDRDLEDGETVSYALMPRDAAGKALVEVDVALERAVQAAPSFGEPVTPYNIHTVADWTWGTRFAQTFVATDDCVLLDAGCISAGDLHPVLTFELRHGSHDGPLLGAPRTMQGSSNQWTRAAWPAGEIALASGETYCLVVSASQEWPIYHTNEDAYALGRLYIDGRPSEEVTESGLSVDMWSTIRCARPPRVHVYNIRVVEVTHNMAAIAWETRLPATGEAAFGVGSMITNTVAGDFGPGYTHRARFTRLLPNTWYGYRVRSVWNEQSRETSPIYWLQTSPE